ncbi:MAG: lipopolysaccharide biosynthesis protein RfbH [Opitutales bacterium]|nr:lipopolysaccharide biosynthesis protein RfbH [Opitutales bacterium]
MTDSLSLKDLKKKILQLSEEYSKRVHGNNLPGNNARHPQYDSFEDLSVPYAGRVFTSDEVVAAVSSSLDFWLTLGPEGKALEEELASFLGIKSTLLVNSGSSANLIAFSTLTSHLIDKQRRIQPGDEVITCAAGFPTTIAPIIQRGCIPVFLDNDSVTGNINCDLLEDAFVEGKTKAVILAHTLGNPFDLGRILEFCQRKKLWLIEDNCDALGCSYSMPIDLAENLGFNQSSPGLCPGNKSLVKWTGTWGDLSTQSFYPPHHLTMGEGGAVNIAGSLKLKRPAESIRDWGRDCWCPSGVDDTCGKRFGWQLGDLPKGYDHKYTYSHLGYNLKPLDIQAAIGRVQMEKLPSFIEARKENWSYLRENLEQFSDYFEFSLPTHATSWTSNGFNWDNSGCRTECSWFGFMLKVRSSAPFSVCNLASYLDSKKIGNRMLFGGNIVRQPVMVQLKKDNPSSFRVIGDLAGADKLMHQALFLGTYPGLTQSMIDYELDIIQRFIKSNG